MTLFPVYNLFDLTLARGEGCYVYDRDDKAYLDLYGGHAVISIGHGHPHYIAHIKAQLEKLPFYSNSVKNPLQEAFAEKLGLVSNLTDYQLFLCNSGAEATENALKLASFQTGNSKVIAFERAFHGRTSAAVNVTDSDKIKAPINKTFSVEFHPFDEIEGIVKSLKKGEVCAVIIEGIQGIGGIHEPTHQFLLELYQMCKHYRCPLILDEIQSGYGRSGTFFAFQENGIRPDLITMAKGMGNGFPIGGVLIHPDIKGEMGRLGSTFGGNHLACAAGMAVLEVIETENLMTNARMQGLHLIEKLSGIPKIKSIRGRGLMIGVEFDFPIRDLRKHLLFEKQMFTGSSSNPNVLRLLPPLSISRAQIEDFAGAFEEALLEIQQR